MSMTIANLTGDGIASDKIACAIELPDSGTSYLVAGTVQPVGGTQVTITGSPVTAPTPPGSGYINWIIQVNVTTGALSIKQAANVPAPAPDAGNDVIFTQTLNAGAVDPALGVSDSTPDTF